MRDCIGFRKLGFAILLAGLLLIVDTTAYAQLTHQDCITCHGPLGDITVFDCLSCHAGNVDYLHQRGTPVAPSFHNADGLIYSKCHTMHSEDGSPSG